MPLRVSAISFLNPAPLLYDFEHEPAASALRADYELHYTSPANCARELLANEADLGLVPIAALTPRLAIVPGCAIAAQREVRSILLLVKNPGRLPIAEALQRVRTVAADAASLSSTAYARILFEHFHHTRPSFIEQPADRPGGPIPMLAAAADAALLIGDPALLAREHRAAIDAQIDAALAGENVALAGENALSAREDPPRDDERAPLLWLDLAALWREHTGLPWVAAVWAIRPEALADHPALAVREALTASRDHGLAAIDDLVREWTPRLAVSPATIRAYLTHNIHYALDPDCLRAIERFRTLAASIGALPPLPRLNLLS